MTARTRALIAFKLGFALLGVSALVTEVAVLVERDRLVAANFFSYFTIQSNIVAAVALLVGAVALAHGSPSAFVDRLRGAATLYIVLVGIAFSLLLAGIEDAEFTAVGWDNVVLHYLVPVALLVDWFADPPDRAIPIRAALLWILYPLVYVIYTLVRGPIADWYPYPFLDPATDGSLAVAVTVAGLLALAAGLAWALTRLPRPRTAGRRAPAEPAPADTAAGR